MIDFKKEDIILVTGASSGIGRGVAQLLNARGATVVGIARNAERLAETKAGCANPENFYAEIRDLSQDIEGLPGYVKELKGKYGKFRGFVHSAGTLEIKPLQMLELDAMKRLYDIALFSAVFMMKGFADRRNNTGRGASSVWISSVARFLSQRGMITYSGAKAAVTASAKCIARELAPHGIRLNTLSPSDIKTGIGANSDSISTVADRIASYPLGIGEVADVANLAVFLLSDEAKWITGQDYIVDCAHI